MMMQQPSMFSSKYRKKPVIVEAILFKNNSMEIIKFCDNNAYETDIGIFIKTLEGDHLASEGDYVIKGIKGEFYPCKPDIFEETYEEVKE